MSTTTSSTSSAPAVTPAANNVFGLPVATQQYFFYNPHLITLRPEIMFHRLKTPLTTHDGAVPAAHGQSRTKFDRFLRSVNKDVFTTPTDALIVMAKGSPFPNNAPPVGDRRFGVSLSVFKNPFPNEWRNRDASGVEVADQSLAKRLGYAHQRVREYIQSVAGGQTLDCFTAADPAASCPTAAGSIGFYWDSDPQQTLAGLPPNAANAISVHHHVLASPDTQVPKVELENIANCTGGNWQPCVLEAAAAAICSSDDFEPPMDSEPDMWTHMLIDLMGVIIEGAFSFELKFLAAVYEYWYYEYAGVFESKPEIAMHATDLSLLSCAISEWLRVYPQRLLPEFNDIVDIFVRLANPSSIVCEYANRIPSGSGGERGVVSETNSPRASTQSNRRLFTFTGDDLVRALTSSIGNGELPIEFGALVSRTVPTFVIEVNSLAIFISGLDTQTAGAFNSFLANNSTASKKLLAFCGRLAEKDFADMVVLGHFVGAKLPYEVPSKEDTHGSWKRNVHFSIFSTDRVSSPTALSRLFGDWVRGLRRNVFGDDAFDFRFLVAPPDGGRQDPVDLPRMFWQSNPDSGAALDWALSAARQLRVFLPGWSIDGYVIRAPSDGQTYFVLTTWPINGIHDQLKRHAIPFYRKAGISLRHVGTFVLTNLMG
jgi:hypothetical protein